MAMMLRQCFPSKWLTADDLKELSLGITVVTIEKVEVYQITDAKGQPDVEFKMKLREFSAPMKLKAKAAWDLGRLLNEEDMEKWAGQVIGIMPVQGLAYGKVMWFINICESRPTTQPTIAPNTKIYDLIAAARLSPALSPAPAPPPIDKTPVGEQTALLIKGALQKYNKTWDDFLRYLKVHGGLEHAFGVELAQLPKGLAPKFNAFIGEARTAATGVPAAAGGEVVDRATGEVIQPAPAPGPIPTTAAAPQTPSASLPVSQWGGMQQRPAASVGPQDDIPF